MNYINCINVIKEKIKNVYLSIEEKFNKYFNYSDVKHKLLSLSSKPKYVKKENIPRENRIPKESFSAAALAVLVIDHGIELMNFAKIKVSPSQESIIQNE